MPSSRKNVLGFEPMKRVDGFGISFSLLLTSGIKNNNNICSRQLPNKLLFSVNCETKINVHCTLDYSFLK